MVCRRGQVNVWCTIGGGEGYEDHPPYDQKDRLRSLSLESHPLPTESQAMPLELVSPYDRGWMR